MKVKRKSADEWAVEHCGLGRNTECAKCVEVQDRYSRLEKQLVQAALAQAEGPLEKRHLGWAAQEASATAWASGFPLLVLPQLLEEKVSTARQRARNQRDIRVRTQGMVALAE